MAPHVHRSDASGCKHHVFLAGISTNILEKSALTGTSFACEEHRAPRVAYQVPGILEFHVIEVNIFKIQFIHQYHN